MWSEGGILETMMLPYSALASCTRLKTTNGKHCQISTSKDVLAMLWLGASRSTFLEGTQANSRDRKKLKS